MSKPPADNGDHVGWPRPSPAQLIGAGGALATLVGVVASIVQIVQALKSGDFVSIYVGIVAVALVGLVIVAYLVRRSSIALYRAVLAVIALLATTIVGTAGVGLGWSIGQTRPDPQTLFVTYASTDSDDAVPGWPVALRSADQPPEQEYRVKETLGYGYAANTNFGESQLVYDAFCRSGAPRGCAGLARSHYYTVDRNQVVAGWTNASIEVSPVARLIVPDDPSTCPDRAPVPVYRFERATTNGVVLFDIGSAAPEATGWIRSQLLGCLRTP